MREALILILAGAPWLALADDWPKWRGPARDGVWREEGIVEALPAALPVRWRAPIGGGFAGPAVARGRVYVCDRVRPGGSPEPENRWNLTDPVDGGERILCLDAATGKVLWEHRYPCRYRISYPVGPRATPTVDGGLVFALGAMGDLLCLDAASGKVVWRKNYVTDFGTRMNPWGMASAPLVDGPRLIVMVGGSEGRGVMALDKGTGEELWRSLDCDDPGYASPILIEHAGKRQLIVWNPVGLHGLDPDTGAVQWGLPFPCKMGHSVATPIFDAERRQLFVTAFFNGPLMVRLGADGAGAQALWRGTSESERPDRTDKLHGLMCTPAIAGDHIYGVCSYGHLRCLRVDTGERVWATLEATGEERWSNAFLVRHRDRFFICNEHGDLILARLSPDGYAELGRARLIEPTTNAGRRMVVWSHPAFADRSIFARNDREIVRADLSAR